MWYLPLGLVRSFVLYVIVSATAAVVRRPQLLKPGDCDDTFDV